MNNLEKPSRNKDDIAYSLAKVGMSFVPGVGGALAEIFSALLSQPLEKRKEQWINNIVDKLLQMEKTVNNFKIENLSENEVFITTILQANQIAIRNHQKEKLEALRNIVLNSALPQVLDTDLQLIFLHLVDELTVSHLNLLTFLNNPKKWCNNNQISTDINIDDFIEQVLPMSAEIEKEYFYQRIVINLQEKGLLNSLNNSTKNLRLRSKFRREKAGYPSQPENFLSKEEIDEEKYLDLIATIKLIKLGGQSAEFTTKFGQLFLDFLCSPINRLE